MSGIYVGCLGLCREIESEVRGIQNVKFGGKGGGVEECRGGNIVENYV